MSAVSRRARGVIMVFRSQTSQLVVARQLHLNRRLETERRPVPRVRKNALGRLLLLCTLVPLLYEAPTMQVLGTGVLENPDEQVGSRSHGLWQAFYYFTSVATNLEVCSLEGA